jgi:hypothetical protein
LAVIYIDEEKSHNLVHCPNSGAVNSGQSKGSESNIDMARQIDWLRAALMDSDVFVS